MAKVKNKRNAGLADKVRNKKKADQNKKKVNPFEVHINREKIKVLGKKSKHDRGLPGVARAKAIQKRKETLGTEMKLMHKSNAFIDKRIGEKNAQISAEDRMIARFAAERTRQHTKKNIYNLADDEILTHRGQTLEQIEKFDDPRSSDDEDDIGKKFGGLDDDFVSEGHFGGGMLSKADKDGAKSHKDLIEQLIAESKKRKAEKQKEKEQTLDLTEKLDSEWKDLQPVVFKKARIEEKEGLIDKLLSQNDAKNQDYDKMMRELKFDKRGTPSDGLKNDEKQAKEEKLRLEQLEKERMQRMLGEDVTTAPRKQTGAPKHRSAEDLDDNLELEDEKEFMLAYDKDGKPLVPDHVLKDYSVPNGRRQFNDGVSDTSSDEASDDDEKDEESEEDEKANGSDEDEQSDDEIVDEGSDNNELKTKESKNLNNSKAKKSLEEENSNKSDDDETEDEENADEEAESMKALEDSNKFKTQKSSENIDKSKEVESEEDSSNADSVEEAVILKSPKTSDNVNKSKAQKISKNAKIENESEEDGSDEEESADEEESDDDASVDDLNDLRMSDKDSDDEVEINEEEKISSLFDLKIEDGDSLKEQLAGKTPSQQATTIQKLIKKYDPGLAENNKDKLSRLFAHMLQYVNDIFNKVSSEGEILKSFLIFDKLAPIFYDLAHTNKVSSKKFLTELLKEKHEIYKKHPKKMPDLDTLIFFKLVSLLYPTSDYRHPVTTPALVFMSEILSTARFNDAYALSRGLFLSALVLEYTVLSKRFVPSAINFLRGLLYLSANTSILSPIQVVPPFRLHRDAKILNLEEDCSKMAVEKKMAAKDLVSKEIDNDFKIRCLLVASLQLREYFDNCNDIEAQRCIFEPHVKLFSRIDLELYPKKVARTLRDVLQHMKEYLETKTYTPLSKEKKRPKALRLYEPDVQEVFTGSKCGKMSREQAERARLKNKVKKEMKGALREIRRDNAYIASVKIKQKIHSDNVRKDKVKQIYKDASIQQGELNQLKRMK